MFEKGKERKISECKVIEEKQKTIMNLSNGYMGVLYTILATV